MFSDFGMAINEGTTEESDRAGIMTFVCEPCVAEGSEEVRIRKLFVSFVL